MTAYLPGAWESFALANAGAAAALAGLVFVGTSINVGTIIKSSRLTARALEAFVLLVGVLLVSVLVLVPDISTTGLGIALLVVGLAIWAMVTSSHLPSTERREDPEGGPRYAKPLRVVLSQAATLPVIIAGVTLLAESGGGIYWLVAAIVFAYTVALANAWVLLVEILR